MRQKWSQYIDKTIAKWGDDVEVSFGSHPLATWAEMENIVTFWEKQA